MLSYSDTALGCALASARPRIDDLPNFLYTNFDRTKCPSGEFPFKLSEGTMVCPLALTLFIASKTYLHRILKAFNYYLSLADGNKGHPLLANNDMLRSVEPCQQYFPVFFLNPAVVPKREVKLATTKFNPESGILWAAIFQYFV